MCKKIITFTLEALLVRGEIITQSSKANKVLNAYKNVYKNCYEDFNNY